MSAILAAERGLYEDVWGSLSEYGDHAPAERFLPIFRSLIGPERRGVTVLDAGCGSGKGGAALEREGFDVRMCDVTDAGLPTASTDIPFFTACLWHDADVAFATRAFGHPGRMKADYVFCCDVLEHLPTQFTMLAIRNMLAVCTRGLFLSVSLSQDNFGVWVGKPLHQTVQPFVWWRDSLRELGDVVDARDMIQSATFFVRPR